MGLPPTQDDATRATPSWIASAWAWLWPANLVFGIMVAALIADLMGSLLPAGWESQLDTGTVRLSVRWLVRISVGILILVGAAGRLGFHLAQRKRQRRPQYQYVLVALRSELVGNAAALEDYSQESGVIAGKGTRLPTDQLERVLRDHLPVLGNHGAIDSVQSVMTGCQKINGLLGAVEHLCSMTPSALESQRHNSRVRRAARDVIVEAGIVLDGVRALLLHTNEILQG